MKGHYGKIAWLLAIITVVSLGLTAFCGVWRDEREDTLSVVASLYPMYTAVLQVADGSDGVRVECLTPPTAGCAHHHQLSPAERVMLGKADVLILNGAGAEEFLSSVLPQLTAAVVDTSAAFAQHDHEEEHGDHTHAMNEHCWMNPDYYAQQVAAIEAALSAADPANAAVYRRNAEKYTEKIKQAKADVIAAAERLPMRQAVLFHTSLPYLAQTMGLTVLGELSIGEDSGFSATEVAHVTDRVKGQAVLFLYDEQYPVQLEQLTHYTDRSATLLLNSAVMPKRGVADKDAWLYAMGYNAQQLSEVAT